MDLDLLSLVELIFESTFEMLTGGGTDTADWAFSLFNLLLVCDAFMLSP